MPKRSTRNKRLATATPSRASRKKAKEKQLQNLKADMTAENEDKIKKKSDDDKELREVAVKISYYKGNFFDLLREKEGGGFLRG
ncbi:MAG: hypothetical protein MMC33_010022 [Icmadophila ericetorum]|nr:hypothetical protein [Icmadophila ericetorum]